MNIERELQVGDSITSKGVKATIKEIISQDSHIPKGDSFVNAYIDIEFIDDKGNYRNWKSELDGGTIEYKKSSNGILQKAINSPLGHYYDPYCGRFGIPIADVDGDKSEFILSLLENGYAMTAYENGGVEYYTIYNLEDDSQGFGKVSKCKEKLMHFQSQFGLRYFTKVPLEEYASNERAQKIIDYILTESAYLSNQVNGYSLALIVEESCFKFIEVLDACI